jgi:hypothetical protein
MTAREIVTTLLEAENGGAIGVVAFGPKFPNGQPFRDMNQATAQMRHMNLIEPPRNYSQPTANPIDLALKSGYSFIQKLNPKEVVVWARKVPVSTSEEAAQRIEMFLGLDPAQQIVHRKSSDDRQGNLISAGSALFGQKEQPQAQTQQPQQPQATASPADDAVKALTAMKITQQDAGNRVKAALGNLGTKASSADLVNFALSGKPQPAPAAKPPATPAASAPRLPPAASAPEPKPAAALQPSTSLHSGERVKLGFSYDSSHKDGCYVAAVHPGEPMALAGIQAGDLITSASYTTTEGEHRERRIANNESLSHALAVVDERYPIILGVYRGGQKLNFPVMAKSSQTTASEPSHWSSGADLP